MNKEDLKKKIKKLTQYPHKQRKENYQSYYLDGEYITGSRDTLYRMAEMHIPEDLSNKSVLDLGCCLGSMCCESYKRGATRVTGIDFEKDYIECAKELANSNNFNIRYSIGDMMKPGKLSKYINSCYDRPIDIIFALSLFKHVKENLFKLLDGLSWKTCYIESNNVGKLGLKSTHAKGIVEQMNNRRWKWENITTTSDRSPRIVFKVVK